MLCSFVQDKWVSWQYFGEITVRHCVGLVLIGCRERRPNLRSS